MGNSINVPIEIKNMTGFNQSEASKKSNSFVISIYYSSNTPLQTLIDKIIDYTKNKYALDYEAMIILHTSFIGKRVKYVQKEYIKNWFSVWRRPITDYNKNDIIEKGLKLYIDFKYVHKPYTNDITCPYICDNDDDALKCPIYSSMKNKYQFSKKNLNHLFEFNHFENEYKSKSICKYEQECKAFIRLENGGNRLDDRCHVKIYRHPPRNNRQIKLSKNINSFIYNQNDEKNHELYKGASDDKKKYKYNKSDGYINALIEEVIFNGYKYDLCLKCSKNDDCKHSEYSLLSIVDEKLNHIRHKKMGYPLNRAHMLSLILYTSCDCNYDLCSSQRSGDYSKWKWFDYNLWWAIRALSLRECGSYKLYSGLNGVKLNKKEIKSGSFITYTSTSWNKNVSIQFMGNDKGMIIEFDENYRNEANVHCCDVSWISKFPDECEVLISRNVDSWQYKFNVSIFDESDGIQTVSMNYYKD